MRDELTALTARIEALETELGRLRATGATPVPEVDPRRGPISTRRNLEPPSRPASLRRRGSRRSRGRGDRYVLRRSRQWGSHHHRQQQQRHRHHLRPVDGWLRPLWQHHGECLRRPDRHRTGVTGSTELVPARRASAFLASRVLRRGTPRACGARSTRRTGRRCVDSSAGGGNAVRAEVPASSICQCHRHVRLNYSRVHRSRSRSGRGRGMSWTLRPGARISRCDGRGRRGRRRRREQRRRRCVPRPRSTASVIRVREFHRSSVARRSAAVPHPDGFHRRLYCIECPESWFEDFGEGTLSVR